MSETSNGEGAAGSVGDLELPQNKKDSEKNRREQENLCIEELAMLISAQIPALSDQHDGRLPAGERLHPAGHCRQAEEPAGSAEGELFL